jgi:hypothetical protein
MKPKLGVERRTWKFFKVTGKFMPTENYFVKYRERIAELEAGISKRGTGYEQL